MEGIAASLSGLVATFDIPLFFITLAVFLGSYLVLAAGSYALLYLVPRHPLSHLKIQREMPAAEEIRRELFWSVIALSIWAVMAVFLVSLYSNGYTLLYEDISRYGWAYFFLSLGALIVTHDAYFYWTHRLMHSRSSFFYRIHNIHHTSVNPTPFAIYTFGPSEAVLLGLYFVVIAFLLPLHVYALLSFFVINTVFNAAGHLGYEFFPASVHETPVGKLLNSSTHHNMHHQFGRSNFSLYFSFWDSLMKTHDTEYRATWDRLHARPRSPL